jgi:hypothetical protein
MLNVTRPNELIGLRDPVCILIDALSKSVKNAKVKALAFSFIIYQALQLQYLALSFEPGLSQ